MIHQKVGAAPRALIGSVRADASDPKAIMAELTKAFEEFKTKNDARLEQLEKGREDAVTKAEVETLNSVIGELQAAIDQQANKLAAAEVNAGGKQVRDPEYTGAFLAHVRKGEVQASLNKGAADEGGYLAPTEWDRTITDKLIELSPMRSIARVQTISTNGFTKLFNKRGTASGWVGETTARTETNTPEFGSLTYNTGEIYANPAATQQMLDDAEIDLESWLANEVNIEFAYEEGLAFLTGDGSNKPNGLLHYVTGGSKASAHPFGAIQTVTSGSNTTVTSDGLIELVYDLPSAFTGNARFIMNRNTMAEIRKLKDKDDQYLWQPSLQVGQPATLLGYGVTEIPAMPDVALNAISVMFGDFNQGYLIVDRIGTRVLRDPFTNKPYVHFYTTKRVGGGLLNPEPLRALKIKAS